MESRAIIGIVVLTIAACSGSGPGDEPEEITCEIAAPAAGDVLHDAVDVQVDLDGPVVRVDLLDGETVLAGADVAEGATSATITWDSTDLADGAVTLVARATGAGGTEATSGGVEVVVDNTAPVASFGPEFPRISVISGEASVPVTVEEDNVESIVLMSGDVELARVAEVAAALSVDTTAVEDGLHHLALVVTDVVGRTAEVTDFPVVVVNNGEHRAVTYDPYQQLYIPTDWASVEHHTRGSALSAPGVDEVISWLVWDASADWTIEYAIGQGLCPHRGIQYHAGMEDDGEIILTLKRSELNPVIVARLPAEDQTSDVFPHNTDALTFGAYFGHAATMDPEDHVEETLPIEMGMVLLYAD